MLQLRMSRTLLLDQALTMLAGAVLGLLFREVRAAKDRVIVLIDVKVVVSKPTSDS